MLYKKKTFDNGTTIGIWKIEEDEEALLSIFKEKQSEYRSEISRFQSAKRRLEFLSVRCLLKELTKNENAILYDKNGHPSLFDNNLKISISHTNGYAAVILHPHLNVGIDIEQKSDKIVRLKHRFLSVEELENSNREREVEYLLLCWSAKETLYKILNETDVDFISHLHISPFFPSKEGGVIHCYETKTAKKCEFLFDYEIEKDYVLVWGFANPQNSKRLIP